MYYGNVSGCVKGIYDDSIPREVRKRNLLECNDGSVGAIDAELLRSMKLARVLPIVASAAISTSTIMAVPITIGSGNPGNVGTENVLFNEDGLANLGNLVQGAFNQSSGFVVDFTSTSSINTPSQGQARISGPFTDLEFSLQNEATFTTAILNMDVTHSGQIQVAVSYLNPLGLLHEELFTVNENGENFMWIGASEGATIRQVSLLGIGTTFSDIAQIRIGGFQTSQNVPDGGATVALLGVGVIGLVAFRKKVAETRVGN